MPKKSKPAEEESPFGCGCYLLLVALAVVAHELPHRLNDDWRWLAGVGVLSVLWLIYVMAPRSTGIASDPVAKVPHPADGREDAGGIARYDWVSNHEVDWTNVPLRSTGIAETGEYAHIEYRCHTTGENEYVVTIFRSGSRAWAVCTCQAGQKRNVCRHRTALYPRLPDIAEFLVGTELGRAWAEYDRAATADPECLGEDYKRTRRALRDAMRPPRGMGGMSQPQGPAPAT